MILIWSRNLQKSSVWGIFQLTVGKKAVTRTDQQGTEVTHVPHLSTGALGKVLLHEETLLKNSSSIQWPLGVS